MEELLKQVRALTERAYTEKTKTHEVGYHVGVSSIVRKTAVEIASELLAWKRGETVVNDVDPYFEFRGDAMANHALRHWPYREVRVRVESEYAVTPHTARLPEQSFWSLLGHMDAAALVEHEGERHFFVAEHKSHGIFGGANETERLGLATRQATLYLAMAEAEAKYHLSRGHAEHLFLPAPWVPDGERLVADETTRFTGIQVAVSPLNPPYFLAETIVSPETRREVLAFYLRKLGAIVASFNADSLKAAEKWDSSEGLTEFTRPVDHLSDPPMDDISEKLADYRKVMDDMKTLEGVKEAIGAEIRRSLESVGKVRAESATHRVVLVQKPGRETVDKKAMEADGVLAKYLKNGKPYSELRVSKLGGDEA